MSKGLSILMGALSEQQIPGADAGKATIGVTDEGNLVITLNDGSDNAVQTVLTPTGGPDSVNAQADDYQLVPGDFGKTIEMSKATANNLTLPDDTEEPDIPVGFTGKVRQVGAGLVSFASGGTINSLGGATDTAGQWSVVYFEKTAADTWLIWGDIA